MATETSIERRTYVVTGCAGFIGSRVTRLLLDAGHEVVGVDDLNGAYDVRLKHWRLERLNGRGGFSFRHGDIRDCSTVDALFAERQTPGAFDGVVNLAARAGIRGSVVNPKIYYETNVLGTLNLLEACRKAGVHRFVFASSSSVYGENAPVPHREGQELGVPLSPYAASKRAGEEVCETYRHLHGIEAVVLRFFSVYGPAGRPDMSPFRFVQWIAEGRPVVLYGDGSQSRDFTFVDDIARGTVAALGVEGSHVLNLGSDRPVSLMEMISLLERLLGRKAVIDRRPANPSDAHTTWADVSRARAVLGWEARTAMEEGLERLVDWYLENRAWARDIGTVDVA